MAQAVEAEVAEWIETHQHLTDEAGRRQVVRNGRLPQWTILADFDASGRALDFHALRHTFVTNLARAGVHPKTAQALARHSTITLTMDRYTHTVLGEQVDALAGLPALPSAQIGETSGPVASWGRSADIADRRAAGDCGEHAGARIGRRASDGD